MKTENSTVSENFQNYYIIKFVSSFSGYSGSSTNKTVNHDITEILLQVVLNTINQPTKPSKIKLKQIVERGNTGAHSTLLFHDTCFSRSDVNKCVY